MSTAFRTSRLPLAIEPAAQRLKDAAAVACERTVESLGLAALTSTSVMQRDGVLAAQFELNRKTAVFRQVFDQTLDDRLIRELRATRDDSTFKTSTSWDTLSLVDDEELEITVSAERLGLEIGRSCEWELRELEGYIAPILATLGHQRLDHDRNPMRPETIGYAVIHALQAVTTRPEIRKVLEGEFARTLASTMPQVYAGVLTDLRNSGLKGTGMSVRVQESSAADSARLGLNSRQDAFQGDTASGHDSGPQSLPRGSRQVEPSKAQTGQPMGQVDAELMALMRRLTQLDRGLGSMNGALGEDSRRGPYSDYSSDGLRLAAPNIIRAHRDELRQMSAGGMDHMVIDLVGSLFDQILSDPKVPPQMARQIGRLQVPVLRTALGDPSFFSSRKHPVRRLINRLASLATALDEPDGERGRELLKHVRELVQGIVDGDFDHAEVYERQLAQLEQFVAEQAQQDLGADGDAPKLLAEREYDIRIQQRFAQRLQSELQVLPGPEFVRDFLSAVWSQAIVKAVRRDGADSPRAQNLRHAARDLFMSVQNKGTPGQRKDFLVLLPKLMQALNEGMDLIGWPDAAKKTFFGLLLPAHAQSLKGEGMSTLDFNMLARRVEQVFDKPLPSASELPAVTDPNALDEQAILPSFTADEARRLGLMPESAVDWNGKVDIDLSAEAPLSAADIAITGLPAPEPVEPTQGRSLADHVQIGFAYQMHLDGVWQKVRLNHVSPGRTFFVFTCGQRHKRTISLTHRMLTRLCDSGRLRAFESAYLLERATARARRQLAALKPASPVLHA